MLYSEALYTISHHSFWSSKTVKILATKRSQPTSQSSRMKKCSAFTHCAWISKEFIDVTTFVIYNINKHCVLNSRKQGICKNVLCRKQFANETKISDNQRKTKILNSAIRKLDNTGSTDRTSSSGHPCSSPTHETLWSLCRSTVRRTTNKKSAHTRLPSVGFRSWSRFLAVSLQVTWIINPAVCCYYFPPGLQLPPQPLRGLLPIFQFCCLVNKGTMGVNSLPKTVTRQLVANSILLVIFGVMRTCCIITAFYCLCSTFLQPVTWRSYRWSMQTVFYTPLFASPWIPWAK